VFANRHITVANVAIDARSQPEWPHAAHFSRPESEYLNGCADCGAHAADTERTIFAEAKQPWKASHTRFYLKNTAQL
jgi:hypothetical protein